MDRSSILRASTIVYSKEGTPCGTPSFCLFMHKTAQKPSSGYLLTRQAYASFFQPTHSAWMRSSSCRPGSARSSMALRRSRLKGVRSPVPWISMNS